MSQDGVDLAESQNADLRRAIAMLQLDLDRRDRALSKLQAELIASRLEYSGARADGVDLRDRVLSLEAHAKAAEAMTMAAEATVIDLEQQLATARLDTENMRNSITWRVTRPLRTTVYRLSQLWRVR